MKKVICSLLAALLLTGIASCSFKKETKPDEKSAELAAEEEYELDFDFVEETEEEGETTWIFLSKDGIIETHVTWDEDAGRFKFTENINRPFSYEEILGSMDTVPTTVPTAPADPADTTDPTTSSTFSYPTVSGEYGTITCFTANGTDYPINGTIGDLINSGAVIDYTYHPDMLSPGQTEYGIDVAVPGVNCWSSSDVDLTKPMLMFTIVAVNNTNSVLAIDDCSIQSLDIYCASASGGVSDTVGINGFTLGNTTMSDITAAMGPAHYRNDEESNGSMVTTLMYGLDKDSTGFSILAFTFTDEVLNCIDVK